MNAKTLVRSKNAPAFGKPSTKIGAAILGEA